MRTLLEAADIQDVKVLSGEGKSSALSLAKSIGLTRSENVAVLVDADTMDARRIEEQYQAFTDLNGSADGFVRLFLAVPTLEEALFPDVETFCNIFKVALTGRQHARFQTDRMSVIRSLLTIPGDGETRIKPHARMDKEAAREGFGRPLLKELLSYLRQDSSK
ncbi:hypothetical protein [Brevundimonas sp.]|uniref:hypothetical protein n=1 Tax=Brevundimonas sp. TaxID=1871086 RepID=UPI0025B8F457|nr:hypothetical protein [Brevundimonas sp.]